VNDHHHAGPCVRPRRRAISRQGGATGKGLGWNPPAQWVRFPPASQESIHEFRKIDADIDLKSILEYIAALPPLNLTYSYETEEQLPGVVGRLSVALARAFTIIDPDLKNPQTKHWERAFRIFDLLL
jgi:Domain of unknown function (DUF1931)